MNSESPPDKPHREFARLISGSAFIFFYRLFGAAVTFLTQVLLARWMGAAELGIYVLAFSWCILLSTLSTGGFRIASIRFIGEGLAASRPGYIAGYVKRSRQIVIILSLAVAILGSLGLLVLGQRMTFSLQNRQRCFETVSQISGAVAGALYGLLIGFEQGVDFPNQQFDFFGKLPFQARGLAVSYIIDSLPDLFERTQPNMDL